MDIILLYSGFPSVTLLSHLFSMFCYDFCSHFGHSDMAYPTTNYNFVEVKQNVMGSSDMSQANIQH